MKALRDRIDELRNGQDSVESARLGEKAVQGFLEHSGIPPATWRGLHVALYRSIPGELSLVSLERRLADWGAHLCYPRIVDAKSHKMEMVLGRGQWVTGALGIQTPADPVRVDPTVIDVVFVPGVAFGVQGERLGRGSGYYDRFLPAAPQALRVALAFDFQLLPKLDQEPWDQRMHWIWTDQRQIRLCEWLPG